MGGDADIAATDHKLPYHLAGDLQYASTVSVYLFVVVAPPLPHIASVDVPYKGSSATMTDLMSGWVDFSISALASVRSEIQAGKLRALAVTSKERMPALPDTPAVAESIPGYEVATWMGIAAPACTPAAVVEQLSRDLNEVMEMPAVRERFATTGADPCASTSVEMRDRVLGDISRWKQLTTARKIDLCQ